MKRILIVTSRAAYPLVLNVVNTIKQQFGKEYSIEVIDLPIDVIALATKEFLEYHLRKLDLSNYDYIVVPGTIRHDLRKLSEEIGVKIVKSPSRISLLNIMFLMGLDKFSPSISGDEIIKKNTAKLIEQAHKYYIKSSKGIKIGELVLPYVPPPFIIGFYVAHKWMGKWIRKYIQRYRPDILYIPSELYDFVQNYINLDEYIVAIPPELAGKEDVESRAKILYGLSPNQIPDYIGSDYILQVNINDPIEIHKIKNEWGKKNKIIFNLVVPSTREKDLLRVLYNIGHIKEVVVSTWITGISSMFDIDSHSLHAFLMELFKEAGISLIIVAESEEKLFWSLREAMISRDLITLSDYLKTEPRDLGLDLLLVKDKEYYDIDLGRVDKVIVAEDELDEPNKYDLDPLGIFKIKVNHREEYIEAMYIGRKGRILIKGKTEEAIRRIILREELISSMSHAFYLGRELGKAEEALRIGKNYEQEKPLFRKPETLKD